MNEFVTSKKSESTKEYHACACNEDGIIIWDYVRNTRGEAEKKIKELKKITEYPYTYKMVVITKDITITKEEFPL